MYLWTSPDEGRATPQTADLLPTGQE